jgi:hypothetical protein
MLVDIGGYYRIQIVHWLDGIQWQLHQAESPGQPTTAGAPPDPPASPAKSPAALLFNGCLILIAIGFGLYFIFMFVEGAHATWYASALVGVQYAIRSL